MRIGEIERIGERQLPMWQPTRQPDPVPLKREFIEPKPIKEPEKVK